MSTEYGWDEGHNCLWCGESGRCRCDHSKAVKEKAEIMTLIDLMVMDHDGDWQAVIADLHSLIFRK